MITFRFIKKKKKKKKPSSLPTYPHHKQICNYFNAYADHFHVREHIRFNTQILSIDPVNEQGKDVSAVDEDTRWRICFEQSESGASLLSHGQEGAEVGRVHQEVFDAVIIANGHHSHPVCFSFIQKNQNISLVLILSLSLPPSPLEMAQAFSWPRKIQGLSHSLPPVQRSVYRLRFFGQEGLGFRNRKLCVRKIYLSIHPSIRLSIFYTNIIISIV